MNDKEFQLLVKAWEMYQNLAKGLGDSCWKIRSIAIGFWSAIIGYAYKENDVIPVYFAILILAVFFFLETGTKRLQYKYIKKSLEVEISLNGILVGDEPNLPSSGITTNIEVPTFFELFDLFRLKRWMFWFPYLFLVAVSIIIIKYIV